MTTITTKNSANMYCKAWRTEEPKQFTRKKSGEIGRTTLLVDPDPSHLETRRLLLLSASYSVQTACAARDVFTFQPEDEPEIALLRDALGSAQLLAIAGYVEQAVTMAQTVPLTAENVEQEPQIREFNQP